MCISRSSRIKQNKLNIAAVCASMNLDATIYSGRYSVNKKPRNEIIENLEGMVVELLKAFQNRNKCFSQKILFYHKGVSEG